MKRLLGVLAMGAVASGAATAAPTDPAALFPANLLLYAEVGNPADTSAAVASYVKDTTLADTLASSHDRRDKLQQPQQLPGFVQSQAVGLFTAPEALAEMKRLQGAAVAVTGIDEKTGKLRWAAAVLLGESHAIGLQFRSYLTLSPNVRRVGKLDGVPIYQNRGLTGGVFDDQGSPKAAEDPVPAEGASEATFLYVPGLFVVGSGKAAVEDVYRRFLGTEKSSSFASNAHLKKATAPRSKAGVFVFADTAGVLGRPAVRALLPLQRSTDLAATAGFLLNTKAVPAITGNILFEKDGLGVVLTGAVEAGADSPLHALAAGTALEPTAIRHSPDALAAFSLGFPAKEKRAKAVLAVADALAVAAGRVGASPSERVAEAKAKGFKLEEDLLPRVAGATVFLAAKLDRPKGVPECPTVALRFDTAADAERWEEEFPKLAALVAGADRTPDASRETVAGVRVSAVVVTVDGQKVPVHYARAAERLVIGVDQKLVATTVKDDGKSSVPLGRTQEFTATGFGFARLAALLPDSPVKPIPPVAPPLPGAPKIEGAPQLDDLRQLADVLERFGREQGPPGVPVADAKALFGAVRSLAPVTVTLGAKGNALRIELWHRDSKKALSATFEQALLWYEQRATQPGPGAPPWPDGRLIERDGPLPVIER